MAYSYKSSINFGLAYIPIELHSTVKNNDISFNQIDRKTMSRVKYVKTCVDCKDRVVKQEDIIKGYEYEKDKYVVFDDEDFEKIKTEKDKNIKIEHFVDIKEIDPLYFDRPYYVSPTGGNAAFALLLTAMGTHGLSDVQIPLSFGQELQYRTQRLYRHNLRHQSAIYRSPSRTRRHNADAI